MTKEPPAVPVSLQKRRQKISDLVSRRIIHTQADLERALRDAGIAVTQATISRDIRALGLRKVSAGDGRQRYAIARDQDGVLTHAVRQVKRLTVDVAVSCNLVVLSCLPASAETVGEAVEEVAPKGLLAVFPHGPKVLLVAQDEDCARQIADQIMVMCR
jgi:transcriptional regulator of arginine metabolism